jgi:hypothetical protein
MRPNSNSARAASSGEFELKAEPSETVLQFVISHPEKRGIQKSLGSFFIRLRQNTLRLAAGMNGEVNLAEAR